MQYSVLHHKYLYVYSKKTYDALHKICDMKPEKIVTLPQIQALFPEDAQTWLVEAYLERLHRWVGSFYLPTYLLLWEELAAPNYYQSPKKSMGWFGKQKLCMLKHF